MALPSIGPRFSRDLPSYRAVLAVDIERFTSFPDAEQARLSREVPEVVADAVRRSGLDWEDRRFPEGTGDGMAFGLPSELTPHLVHPFLDELQKVLAEKAEELRARDPVLRMRMRVSIHLGPLPDEGGESDGVGKARNDTHRLLDCRPVRDCLSRTDPDTTFVAAVISDRVYTDVVAAGYTELNPYAFTKVRAQVKQFDEDAWLYVPVLSGEALVNGLTPDEPGTGDDGDALPATPGAFPVSGTELERARRWYATPPGGARAAALLRHRHLVVLVAERGGRRTTALHLLGELAADTGISVADVRKDWDHPDVWRLPLHTGCGYLLDLNDPVADRPGPAFAEDLLTHAERLVDRGSYLVITVPPDLWRDCRPAGTPVEVDLGLPDPAEVLALHLRRLGARPPAADPGLKPETRPDLVVQYAELHHSGFDPEPPAPEVYLRLTGPDGGTRPYPLRDKQVRRTRVTFGRRSNESAPDIELNSRRVSRRHCELVYHERSNTWTLIRHGKNPPWLAPRGGDRSRVDEEIRVRDGDEIWITGDPEDGRETGWLIEFCDPMHTASTSSTAPDPRPGKEIP